MVKSQEEIDNSLFWKKILSAVFYGVSSFMRTVVNKTILTSYGFPSFQVLGVGQMVATIVVLYVGKKLRIVSFPGLELSTFRKIFPLPLIYIGNMFFWTWRYEGAEPSDVYSSTQILNLDDDDLGVVYFRY